jgi:hypothetical protein
VSWWCIALSWWYCYVLTLLLWYRISLSLSFQPKLWRRDGLDLVRYNTQLFVVCAMVKSKYAKRSSAKAPTPDGRAVPRRTRADRFTLQFGPHGRSAAGLHRVSVTGD